MRKIYKHIIANKIVAVISIIIALIGIIGLKEIISQGSNINIYYLIGILMILLVFLRTIISDFHLIFMQQNNTYCDIGQYGSKYDLEHFLTKDTYDLFIIGQNLRTILSEKNLEILKKYLDDENENKYLTLILSPYDVLKNVFPLSAADLTLSIKDLKTFVNSLTENKKQRLKIGFHFGTITLSAMIKNPKKKNSIIVLNPRWAFDRSPNNRLFCVIRKDDNQECFNAIWGGVTSMLFSECKTLEEVDKMINK